MAVTVDLDGTLADVTGLKLRMWPALLRAPRVVLGWTEVVEGCRGLRDRDLRARCIRELAEELGVAEGRVEAVVAREIDHRWPQLYRHARRRPALEALLRRFQERGVPLAVVSDYPGLAKLDALDLHFDLVVDCRALGALKPLPDGLLAAAAQMGVPSAGMLHIGDRWDTDGLAASRAGARFLHVDRIITAAAADEDPEHLL